MAEALERAIVSGASVEDALETARQAQYRSTSPTRSASPSTSEELGSDASRAASPSGGAPSVPVDRPGANTGVKGVRADARASEAAARAERVERVHATNANMERLALNSGTTWREDEALRKLDDEAAQADAAELERIRSARVEQLRAAQRVTDERRRRRLAGEEEEEDETVLELPQEGVAGAARRAVSRRTGFFGHLREVDEAGYADAIDREAPTTSVVVHLYERIVPACARLTASLASLARLYPHTKFLQARASDIGFGTGGADPSEDDEESRLDKAAELVPTLLVYRAGVVVANLVRVDLDEAWGGGEERSIRELLASHGAIFTTPAPVGGANGSIARNAANDDEDD